MTAVCHHLSIILPTRPIASQANVANKVHLQWHVPARNIIGECYVVVPNGCAIHERYIAIHERYIVTQ